MITGKRRSVRSKVYAREPKQATMNLARELDKALLQLDEQRLEIEKLRCDVDRLRGLK